VAPKIATGTILVTGAAITEAPAMEATEAQTLVGCVNCGSAAIRPTRAVCAPHAFRPRCSSAIGAGAQQMVRSVGMSGTTARE
jgi:hypothetical protein